MELLPWATYLALLSIGAVNGDILVYTEFSNQLIEEFRDLPAKFGWQLPSNGFRVHAIAAEPLNGCTKLVPPPKRNETEGYKWAAIIARYNCTFEEKVRNAQLSGYDAVIVYNLESNDLEQMSAKNDDGITIPSVFVGETTGKILIINYQYQDGFALVLNDELPFNINTHLILPFSIVVGLCFIIMIGFMIVKCVREQRRLRRHRLPSSVLKTIPTIKFNKNHPYEMCVICLDDYIEGDKLRVLPCSHAYHCKCIDQWLTKNRRVCPICKRKVLPRRQPRERRSSNDSSSDSEPDDTTPLINPVEHSNTHGTFNQPVVNEEAPSSVPPNNPNQRVNPFDREPNLPPNLVDQIEPVETLWSRLHRMFGQPSTRDLLRFGRLEPELNNIVTGDTVAVAVPSHQRSSSNNILNLNLSGSFRDHDGEEAMTRNYSGDTQSDDENYLGRRRRATAAATTTTTTTTLPAPSSSTQARLGVAAIPNTQFCPTTPPSQRSNRSKGRGNDDFVV